MQESMHLKQNTIRRSKASIVNLSIEVKDYLRWTAHIPRSKKLQTLFTQSTILELISAAYLCFSGLIGRADNSRVLIRLHWVLLWQWMWGNWRNWEYMCRFVGSRNSSAAKLSERSSTILLKLMQRRRSLSW